MSIHLKFAIFNPAASRRLPGLLLLAALTIAGVAAAQFVWSEDPASFADDSVSYLIMGRCLSPWFESPPALRAACAGQRYPPLFPLALALSGASQHIPSAHLLVVIFLLPAGLVLYRLAGRVFCSRWLALLLTCLFLASPTVWINIQGILSENLYLLVSLLVLAVYSRHEDRIQSKRFQLLLAALLCAAVLTRTIGISLPAACAVLALAKTFRDRKLLRQRLFPPGLAVALLALYYALQPSRELDHYLPIRGLGGEPGAGLPQRLIGTITPQLGHLYDAWLNGWLIYWTESFDFRKLLMTAFGLLALCGMLYRACRLHLDAWYALVYLAMLCIWPHQGQMTRFLYPIFPVLMLQGFFMIDRLFRLIVPESARAKLTALALLSCLFLTAPALGFYYHRAGLRAPAGYARISEFYRVPQTFKARAAAALQVTMFEDFRRMRAELPPDARVMWYKPAYVNLLAERYGLPLPVVGRNPSLLSAVAESNADYIYLSRLHPRISHENFDVLEMYKSFRGWTEVLWENRSREDYLPVSMMLRVDRRKLEGLLRNGEQV